jgi:predicted esterase
MRFGHRDGVRKFGYTVAIATSLAALAMTRDARGECRVTPGPEGAVSTWLVAGPVVRPPPPRGATVEDQLAAWIRTTQSSALAAPSAGTPLAGVPGGWRALARADDRMRIDDPPLARGAHDAWIATRVTADRARRIWLFAGADDGFAVFLDGREIARRAGVHDALDDDEAIALDLTAGPHVLAVAMHVNGGAMHWLARFVGDDFAPASGITLTLPGVDDTRCDELARDAVDVDRPVRVTEHGLEIGATAAYPGGSAHRADEIARTLRIVDVGSHHALASRAITVDGAAIENATIAAEVADDARSLSLELTALEPRSLDVRLAESVRRAIRLADRVLAPFDEASPPAFLPRESLTSVRYVAERLARLVRDRDDDDAHLADEANTLEDLVHAIEQSRDPYTARRGALRRGYRSSVDDTLQGYSIYVPPSYRADRPFPLVVALHGLGGTSHRMLPVLFGIYDEHESREHADRHIPPLPDTQAILVAPYGFGDTGYRALGETDVMAVIDEVKRAYRIDANRVYMTGLSMGGIGAASIPLHHPDVFAAAAPLCGYHSYFVRHDTDGARQPWEPFLMESRSNASWAENALHMPFYVVHGTLDRPVANSRVLVDRLLELRYDVQAEWPALGHNVWSTTYAGGRIVPHFRRYQRDPTPRRIRFRTASMRWNRSDWIAIDSLAARDRWGEVDASVSGSDVRVETDDVRAITLSPPASLFPAATENVTVRVDGRVFTIHPGDALSLRRGETDEWHTAPRVTDAPIGPIRDVFDGAIVVAYGTHDANERALDLRVAQAWARIHRGVRAHIAVIADDDVTADLARTHHLVLVGTPRANSYLARIQDRLPMRVDDTPAVRLGAQTWRGPQVGAVFAAANPEAPDRAVVVVTGTSALGVWRSRFLPDLVPDYVVFDEHVAPARGRVILGTRATVLAAGYWNTSPN